MGVKRYTDVNVLDAARGRVREIFDGFKRIYVAFSGGKDSSVMMHLVLDEAVRRGRTVGVMYIDFEAQYADTIKHVEEMRDMYAGHIDFHWVCVPTKLRNSVSAYEPQWLTWDPERKADWIRDKPAGCKTECDYPFSPAGMEFEEFIVAFGDWYSQGEPTAACIGIRAQESLHRYCAIATWEKHNLTFNGRRWTTKVQPTVWNCYPIYDWLTSDIWLYHARHPEKPHNAIYDKMAMAGVPLAQQRLCQPFGDDQRRGLWLYHILEPDTWAKLIARVNGANSGALYIKERGNIMGYDKITLPQGHTWRSFCNLLLETLPKKTREHYIARFRKFIHGWRCRGYTVIPDESPRELESKCWAPSWRRMCKVLLRNDWWCKGLGQAQPKSDAWLRFKEMRAKRRAGEELEPCGLFDVEEEE